MSSSNVDFDCTKQAWGIRGRIVHGHGRGGTMLGFPTANIEVENNTASSSSTAAEGVAAPTTTTVTEQRLKEGINHVFFGWGVVEPNLSDVFPVVMSVGYNPHFKDVHKLAIEAHYLHKFAEDFYDQHVRVAVLGEIRTMGAFTTLEALIEVIRNDCEVAKERLASLEEWKGCAFLKAETKECASVVGPQLVAPLAME